MQPLKYSRESRRNFSNQIWICLCPEEEGENKNNEAWESENCTDTIMISHWSFQWWFLSSYGWEFFHREILLMKKEKGNLLKEEWIFNCDHFGIDVALSRRHQLFWWLCETDVLKWRVNTIGNIACEEEKIFIFNEEIVLLSLSLSDFIIINEEKKKRILSIWSTLFCLLNRQTQLVMKKFPC